MAVVKWDEECLMVMLLVKRCSRWSESFIYVCRVSLDYAAFPFLSLLSLSLCLVACASTELAHQEIAGHPLSLYPTERSGINSGLADEQGVDCGVLLLVAVVTLSDPWGTNQLPHYQAPPIT